MIAGSVVQRTCPEFVSGLKIACRTGGKSELHRAGWSLTATGGDPKESATENIPPGETGSVHHTG